MMMTKIFRCNYCRVVLGNGRERNKHNKLYGYCSEWCHEMEHLPEVKNVCYTCGVVVEPIPRGNTKHKGGAVYPKMCPVHAVGRYAYKVKRDNKK